MASNVEHKGPTFGQTNAMNWVNSVKFDNTWFGDDYIWQVEHADSGDERWILMHKKSGAVMLAYYVSQEERYLQCYIRKAGGKLQRCDYDDYNKEAERIRQEYLSSQE